MRYDDEYDVCHTVGGLLVVPSIGSYKVYADCVDMILGNSIFEHFAVVIDEFCCINNNYYFDLTTKPLMVSANTGSIRGCTQPACNL